MPTVKQFGFSTRSGSLANIVDGDVSTGWAPLADGLPTYTDPFLVGGLLNTAGRFAAIEFDYGVPVRMSAFLFQVETRLSLGASVLVGSENPATSTADTVQSGDQLLGTFSAEQMTSGHVNIVTPARVDDSHDARVYAHRYYRFLQRTSNPTSPGGLPSDPTPTLGSNFAIYDQFSGDFTTPTYSVLTIELWGGGASGGLAADSNAGADSTVLAYSLRARGGHKPSATAPNTTSTAAGGVASGGNTENTDGQDGEQPFPADGTTTVGHSGKGGDSPHGGLGGPEVFNDYNGQKLGIDGTAPGGGGSGLNTLVPSGDGTFYKYPGGAGGGYVKHVLTFGAGGPNPGDTIAWVVGAGGLSNSKKNGNGANGRVKFSWT